MWKGEKQAIITVIKQWKDREGQGTLGKQPLSRVPGLAIQMLMEDTDSMYKLKSFPTRTEPMVS